MECPLRPPRTVWTPEAKATECPLVRQKPLSPLRQATLHRAQGRGFEPRPTEVGHSTGPGEPVVQPATFYSPRGWGRKGLWSVCVFRLLPDTLTFEVQHLRTNKRTGR